ncbi:MAG: M20/M25/M40 family metallo-hydrolase [Bacteroidales bacterium]|nr:M20/M25/M40 family metallo-hydrolase [Bacteroidales bacterium]
MKKIILTSSLLLAFLFSGYCQDDSSAYNKGFEAITLQAVKGQLDFLASDWTEGRGTGMRGEYIASDYISSIFSVYGLEPGGDEKWHYPPWQERMKGAKAYKYRTYFQEVDLIKFKAGDKQVFSLNSDGTEFAFNYHTDFSLRPGSIARRIEAPLVFVGYGYVNEDEKYDDYKGVDVNGKVVVRLAGYPGYNDTASNAYKRFHPEGRYSLYYLRQAKDEIAEEKGALGIIEIYPGSDLSGGWVSNIPFRQNDRFYEGEKELNTISEYSYSIPGDSMRMQPIRVDVSKRVAYEIFKGSGIETESWEARVKEKMKPDSKVLKGKSVRIETSVESELIRARNVIGVIPGKDTTKAIVIGAHYDHLGMFDGYIWNGADDNASGTVGVMTIAKACLATGEKPEKTIVFAAWTGEERGLLGSRYFVEHPWVPIENITFHLNYDMISRDDDNDSLKNQCRMTYTAGEDFLEENAAHFLQQYKINLDVTNRPTTSKGGGSDHSPFARKDVPFFYFMAGFHKEYHSPKDETELVNYQKMTDIIRLGFLHIWTIANN